MNERRIAEDNELLNRVNGTVPPVAEPEPILNLDFNQWVKTYEGPRFNFVHCDFPYGIEADTFNQGAAATHGGYVDTARTYWTLCESLVANLPRITTESCHFMFWFSMHYYQPTIEFFRKYNVEFDPFPLVWIKSDNVGIL